MKYNVFIKWKSEKEVIKMEQMKEVFNGLTDANKEVINLVAKGMYVAQEAEKEKIIKEGEKIKND